MSIETKVAKLQKELDGIDKVWEARQRQLESSFQQEYGVYVGRKNTIVEIIEMLTQDDDEKKDESDPEPTENVPTNIVEEPTNIV